MPLRDLAHYKSNTRDRPGLKLDLGCGSKKIGEDWIGVDLLEDSQADVVADVLAVLELTHDSSVSEVNSKHFFEHVNNIDAYFTHLSRVLKVGAQAFITVPHFSCPFYYSDPTHKVFFGLYTFNYMSSKPYRLRRQVPRYNLALPLEVISIKLVFDSNFLLLKPLAKILTVLINSTRLFQEIHEALFCWILPCHELRVSLRKI